MPKRTPSSAKGRQVVPTKSPTTTIIQGTLMPSAMLPIPINAPQDSHTYVQSLLARIQQQDVKQTLLDKASHPLTKVELILLDAHLCAQSVHDRLVASVPPSRPVYDVLLQYANLCLNGPVGLAGHRAALRVVANLLLDTIIEKNPNHAEALCVKGEALLPPGHYGRNDPFTPRSVLQEAYVSFARAAASGSMLASFLQGRWLLAHEFLHKNQDQARVGRDYILSAARRDCPRALLFLTQDYENTKSPDSLSDFCAPTDTSLDCEQRVLELYIRAANHGSADALNDIGTAYAQGYGGLPLDFDKAVLFYEAAIRHGSILAFDNLGAHYETGMDGHCKDKVDHKLALYYYRQGTKKRCPKCAYNLGTAYEEGMKGVFNRDLKKAEKYYLLSLRLADDVNDAQTGGRALFELVALYVTRFKLDVPDGEDGLKAMHHLMKLVRDKDIVDTFLAKINRAIALCRRLGGRRIGHLSKYVGDQNASMIMEHLNVIERRAREGDAPAFKQLSHVLGKAVNEEVENVRRSKRSKPSASTRSSRSATHKKRRKEM